MRRLFDVSVALAVLAVVVLAVLMAGCRSGWTDFGSPGRSEPVPTPTPTPSCKASTDIEAFKDRIARACGDRIRSVSLTGNPDTAKYEIAYALDLDGLEVGGTPLSVQAYSTALAIRGIVKDVYPTKHFIVAFRDANGPVCAFVFSGENDKPDEGFCQSQVVK